MSRDRDRDPTPRLIKRRHMTDDERALIGAARRAASHPLGVPVPLPEPAVFAEIRAKLEAAGYDHALLVESDDEVIDMHGIALQAAPSGTVP